MQREQHQSLRQEPGEIKEDAGGRVRGRMAARAAVAMRNRS